MFGGREVRKMRFNLLCHPFRIRWEHRASRALGPAQANDKLHQQDKLEGTYITDIPQSLPTQLFAMREDSPFCRATITEAERVSGILCHSVDANAQGGASRSPQVSGKPSRWDVSAAGNRMKADMDIPQAHCREWSTTQTR
jgi:hypothetical protein